MDVVVPGRRRARPCRCRLQPQMREQAQVARARELRVLRDIYDDHAGLQDRFRTCGEVPRELAAKLGLVGFAARASGLQDDLRCDFPTPPYEHAGSAQGDARRRATSPRALPCASTSWSSRCG